MAGSAEPSIVCAKCGSPSTGAPACARCGGGMAKLCPQCQCKNSLAKNFCDGCGAILAVLPRSPADGIPQTEIRRSPAEPPPGLPPAGRSEQAYTPLSPTAPTPANTASSAPKTLAAKLKPGRLILAMGLALAGFYALSRRRPQTLVPRLAEKYLGALSRKDYALAYSMLSRAARSHCTLEEFRLFRAMTPWTWSDVTLVTLEPDAALVQYDLALEGRPPEKDFLFFTLEDGKWARPYNWNLLKKIESAFDKNNPDMALLYAQTAVRINPRDPMARGYLCEAVYYRKVPPQTQAQCALALEIAQRYPSKLSPKSLYHLHAILGDTYKNDLRKYPEAIAEYDVLLSFPRLSPEDQCDLLIARADAHAGAGQKPKAEADLGRAQSLCAKPSDLDYIRRKREGL